MRYLLKRLVLGSPEFVEISHSEYENIAEAREGLSQALSAEERLDLLLTNYAEYEQELLSQSLSEMLFPSQDWSSSMSELYLTNRRLVNLLTTCRLYVDQIPHVLAELYGNGEQVSRIKVRFSEEYDRRLGYRALEAMRNYVQHRGLLVHNLNFHRWWDETGESRLGKATVTPSVNTRRLAEDRKFKRSVLQELELAGDLVDLKPLVRDYIEGLTGVHLSVREVLAPDVERWEETIKSAMERFANEHPGSLLGLAAVKTLERGRYTDAVPVFDEPIKRRRWLERKNRSFPYSRHIVSGEVRH